MSKTKSLPGSGIERARRRLERWRAEHGGSGNAIPEALWTEAAAVAREEGVAETARALRLDRYRLARRTAAEDGAGEAGPTFVELSARELCVRSGTVVRFESREGDRIEVELGAQSVDVVALAHAFLSRSKSS